MPWDIFEAFGWVLSAFLGWRYIFSNSFRERTHRRWKQESKLTVGFEIGEGVIGVAVTLLLVYIGGKAFFAL
jgi:hypothetical protein